jgi:hypothetical protein
MPPDKKPDAEDYLASYWVLRQYRIGGGCCKVRSMVLFDVNIIASHIPSVSTPTLANELGIAGRTTGYTT